MNHKPGFVQNSTLIIFAFATVFFPRIIDAVGAPSVINFGHFMAIPLCCAIVIFTSPTKDKQQIALLQSFLIGLFIFFAAITLSAFLNSAGYLNLVLAFALLSEPFVFLLAVIYLPILSRQKLNKLKNWALRFAVIHLLLAFCQKIALSAGILARTDMTEPDNVQGVFYLSGGGHVVAASVSMTFGLYFWIVNPKAPIWMRGSLLVAGFTHLVLADAKQVILVWLLAWIVLVLVKLKNIKIAITYLTLAVVSISTLLWCAYNIETFRHFKTWIRPGYYGPDGEATQLKISGIKAILSYYETPLNWILGLGPGHTVGRLGGWMLVKYESIFTPLGATIHPVGGEVFDGWLSTLLDSSFFSPLFGWAGIWGDFGILGLMAYLYFYYLIWQKLCLDDFSRFILITIVITGFIHTQMEEPGYMVTSTFLIALRWKELYYFKT